MNKSHVIHLKSNNGRSSTDRFRALYMFMLVRREPTSFVGRGLNSRACALTTACCSSPSASCLETPKLNLNGGILSPAMHLVHVSQQFNHARAIRPTESHVQPRNMQFCHCASKVRQFAVHIVKIHLLASPYLMLVWKNDAAPMPHELFTPPEALHPKATVRPAHTCTRMGATMNT